jgi:uncharacterized protein HemY
VIIALISAKSAGYLLYKEVDRPFLKNQNIKNSITAVEKETIIIISTILWLICFLFFIFLKFIILIPLAILPIAVIYFSALGKIKTKIKYLRIAGFIYWLFALIIILKLLW